MITEAAGTVQHDLSGFAPVPRLQIVTVAGALRLRDRTVRRDHGYRRAVREEDRGAQSALNL
jgi:hypothetical protein